MLDKITALYQAFLTLTQTQPIIAGAVGLYGLGIVTYFLRDIPSRIYLAFKKECFTSVTLNSNDYVYDDFLVWISKNKTHNFIRNFNIMNKYSSEYPGTKSDTPFLTIGYGRIYFMFEGAIMFMDRHKIEAPGTDKRKEVINVTMFGRNRSVFEKLFTVIKSTDDDKYTKIMSWDHGWYKLSQNFKRDLDTVVIDKTTKDCINNHIAKFLADKEWYHKNGIPWRTGIMLSGPPGTGKTSLIRALCASIDSDLYIVDMSRMSGDMLNGALSSVPERCIVTIEDIDAHGSTKSREKNSDESSVVQMVDDITQSGGLSGILNAIDGASSGEGRILIATTNHIEKLDPALLREGRFDLKVEIGYMSQESFEEYMLRFYPGLDLTGCSVVEGLAPCTLQQLVFENRESPENVLEKVSKK